MGVAIPQVLTEDRVSGAQIVDGSTRFVKTSENVVTYLKFIPSSTGNRRTSTFSCWLKRGKITEGEMRVFNVANPTGNQERTELGFGNQNIRFHINSSGTSWKESSTTSQFRDSSGWYHIMWVLDSTQSNGSDQRKVYVNGIQQPLTINTALTQNEETPFNVSSWTMYLGVYGINTQNGYDGLMSQAYWIDGQALGPEYFGYTDPLTNTWRPKKYTGSLKEAEGNGNNAWNQEYTNSCLGFYFNNNPPIWLGRLRRTGSTSYASAVTFGTSTGVTLTSGDTLMWAYDESAAKLWVGRNGTWYASGDPANGTNATFAGFPTNALLFKTLYYQDSGVPNGSDLYLTRITSGSASYSTPSGFSYWDGMNLNWKYGGGSTSSTSQADYIPQRITGKVYFETTVHWTDSGGWADYRIAGLSDEGNANINSFYLPFEGSAPIGQDQSGNGNNWTPVNFGGSNTLEKATGALPILNTDGGGKTAQPGVLGSKVAKTYTVTVPGGTGGGFYLDGVQKPTLSFIRGATYTFDQSDASNSGHPLQFSGTLDGGTYTDGVTTSGTPGSAGAYTRITVPHDSVNTLYYKCGNHSGMGASISVTTDVRKADLYAWKNVLALPLVGIKSDFSNAINSGTSNKAITTVGNAAASSVQSNFYGGSFTFDGTGDALTITNSDMSMGTSDFTCEGWFYYNALPSSSAYRLLGNVNVSGNSTEWQLIHQTAGTLTLWNGSSYVSTGTAPISTSRWTHLAVVRASNVQTLYVNGIAQSTTVTHTGNLTHNMLDIGGRNDGAESFNGYIQDARVYKGLAKYTQNFIPASTDPDILPDTPSGVSYSSNVTPITDGAVAFDGSGDYLSISDGSDCHQLILTDGFILLL
jgi:hypothetical protein